ALFMRGRGAKARRPVGPHRIAFDVRRHREQFEICHRPGAVTIGRSDAIRARVAAADDHDVLVPGPEIGHALVASDALVLQGQELHRIVHARKLAPRDGQVARHLGASGEHHGIEIREHFGRGNKIHCVIGNALAWKFRANTHASAKLNAFGAQLGEPAVDDFLVELEIRDAVAQQSADAVVLFEYRDPVASARQLLRAGEAGGAGADNRNLLARLVNGGLRFHPARFPGLVDDRVLDRLDADRVLVDAQNAGLFAGCGADAAGELREIVGRMQRLDRVLPVAAIDQVVPVRNDIVDRAALHAKRDAAIHAARALHLGILVGKAQVELAIVLLARVLALVRLLEALVLQKPRDLSHRAPYAAWRLCLAASSPRARRYSFGNTFTNFARYSLQRSRTRFACALPV